MKKQIVFGMLSAIAMISSSSSSWAQEAKEWTIIHMKFKSAAEQKKLEAEAKKCAKDPACYQTKIEAEQTAAGGIVASALSELPPELWNEVQKGCRGAETKSIDCITKKLDGVIQQTKAGTRAVFEGAMSPDDRAFPQQNQYVANIVNKACDFAQNGEKLSEKERTCVGESLDSISVAFNNASNRLKLARQHLIVSALTSGVCQKQVGKDPSCTPSSARAAYVAKIEGGLKASAGVDMVAVAQKRGAGGGGGGTGKGNGSGGAADGVAAAGANQGGDKGSAQGVDGGKNANNTPAGTLGGKLGDKNSNGNGDNPNGSPGAGGEKDGVKDGASRSAFLMRKYLDPKDLEKCKKGLQLSGDGSVNLPDCKPSENEAMKKNVANLAAVAKINQRDWDPKVTRELDMAQELLRSRAMKFVQDLAESNLGACGYSKALDQLAGSCKDPTVEGKKVTGFSSPIASIVAGARAKYLKNGDQCDGDGKAPAGEDLLKSAHDARADGALEAARELVQLDVQFAALAADFSQGGGEEEFFKSYPQWLPCRTILDAVGVAKNFAAHVSAAESSECKDVKARLEEGGGIADMSVDERTEKDEFNGHGYTAAERAEGEKLKADIEKLEYQRDALLKKNLSTEELIRQGGKEIAQKIENKTVALEILRKKTWSAADQLMSRGISINTPTSEGTVAPEVFQEKGFGGQGRAHRCFAKGKALEKVMARMAQLTSQFPELAAKIDGKPAYVKVASNTQVDGARAAFDEGSKAFYGTNSAMNQWQGEINTLCEKPVDSAEYLLNKNDQLLEQSYACSTDVNAVEPAFAQAEIERAAACQARRDLAGNACSEVKLIRAKEARFEAGMAGLGYGMKALDVLGCVSLVGGVVKGVGKAAVTGIAEGAKDAATKSALSRLGKGAATAGWTLAKGTGTALKTTAVHTFASKGAPFALGMLGGMGGFSYYEMKKAKREASSAAVLAREGYITPEQAMALQEAGEHAGEHLVRDLILGLIVAGPAEGIYTGIAENFGKEARTFKFAKTAELDSLFAKATDTTGQTAPVEANMARQGFRKQVIDQIVAKYDGRPEVRKALEGADDATLAKMYRKGQYTVPKKVAEAMDLAKKQEAKVKAATDFLGGVTPEGMTLGNFVDGLKQIASDKELPPELRANAQRILDRTEGPLGNPEKTAAAIATIEAATSGMDDPKVRAAVQHLKDVADGKPEHAEAALNAEAQVYEAMLAKGPKSDGVKQVAELLHQQTQSKGKLAPVKTYLARIKAKAVEAARNNKLLSKFFKGGDRAPAERVLTAEERGKESGRVIEKITKNDEGFVKEAKREGADKTIKDLVEEDPLNAEKVYDILKERKQMAAKAIRCFFGELTVLCPHGQEEIESLISRCSKLSLREDREFFESPKSFLADIGIQR